MAETIGQSPYRGSEDDFLHSNAPRRQKNTLASGLDDDNAESVASANSSNPANSADGGLSIDRETDSVDSNENNADSAEGGSRKDRESVREGIRVPEGIRKGVAEMFNPPAEALTNFVNEHKDLPRDGRYWLDWGNNFREIAKDFVDGPLKNVRLYVLALQEELDFKYKTKNREEKRDGLLGYGTLKAIAKKLGMNIEDLVKQDEAQRDGEDFEEGDRSIDGIDSGTLGHMHEVYQQVYGHSFDRKQFFRNLRNVHKEEISFIPQTKEDWQSMLSALHASQSLNDRQLFELMNPESIDKGRESMEGIGANVNKAVKWYEGRMERRVNAFRKGRKQELLADLKELEVDSDDWFNDIDDLGPAIEGLTDEYRKLSDEYDAAYTRGEGFDEKKGQRNEAYQKLEKAVQGYLDRYESVTQGMTDEYRNRLTELARKYDLESNVDLTQLRFQSDTRVRDYDYMKDLWKRNPHPVKIDAYKNYFKGNRVPTRTVKSKDDLKQLVKGENENEKRVNAERIWNGLTLDEYNASVLYKNYLDFARGHEKILRDLDSDRSQKLKDISNLKAAKLLS